MVGDSEWGAGLDRRLENLILHTPGPLPVLLGAGSSVAAGAATGLRIARHLRDLVSEAGDTSSHSDLHEELLESFEDSMAALGGGLTVSGLHLQRYLAGLHTTDGHRGLAHLAKRGVIGPVFITTNFDTLVEDVFREEGLRTRVHVAGLNDPETLDCVGDEAIVVKLHGDAHHPQTLRLVPQSIERLSDQLEVRVADLVRQHGLLVLGHQLRDPDLVRVLRRAAPTERYLGIVNPAGIGQEAATILAAHNSEGNFSLSTFESFVTRLSDRSRQRADYEAHERNIQGAWSGFDRLRYADGGLAEVETQVEGLPDGLAEVAALRTLLSYESDGRGDPHQLRDGLLMLERAFDQRRDRETRTRLRIASRYLGEFIAAVLSGNEVPFTAGTETAEDPLATLLHRTRDDVDLPRAELYALEVSALEVGLGEATKELYTRHGVAPDSSALFEATKRLESALSRLESDTPTYRFEQDIIQASAYRHLAVVYEYRGARATSPFERRRLYQEWLRCSRQAIEICTGVSEHRVCGYSHLNLAAALVAVEVSTSGAVDPNTLQRARQAVHDGRSHLLAIRDERGLAWSHLHAARLIARMLAIPEAGTDYPGTFEELCGDLEREAFTARTWARRADDNVASGLANLYAAYASMELARTQSPDDTAALRTLHIARDRAGEAEATLTDTHRLPQAARAAQIRAEAVVRIAGLVAPGDTTEALGEGIRILSGAVKLLADVRGIEPTGLERHFGELSASIESAVPRALF